ncbi:MAG TPA: deoxyribonuclease IV [Pirellulaceae bacterium]|nr:deoxyribonuclease IV [Pirellulaceae bacterium]
MPLLGAHMSIAGGLYKAVEAAAKCGMDVVQIFTGSPRSFPKPSAAHLPPVSEKESLAFQTSLSKLKIAHPLSHCSYLINFAAPDDTAWRKSIDFYALELRRAEQLRVPYVVMHPGSFTSSSEEAGLERIAQALDELHALLPNCKSHCLLENTAGQGTNLGNRFEHLATILQKVKQPERVGVCFDTCHAFAAGYPMADRQEYLRTMQAFDQLIGLDKLRAFHLNDSKKGLGSRVDRHEHIGQGELGVEAFRHLLNDKRFRDVPMYLETPKGDHEGEEWDVINLRLLRSLVK